MLKERIAQILFDDSGAATNDDLRNVADLLADEIERPRGKPIFIVYYPLKPFVTDPPGFGPQEMAKAFLAEAERQWFDELARCVKLDMPQGFDLRMIGTSDEQIS